MVVKVTALGRNGVSDWLIQRISAMILLAYIGVMVSFFAMHPNLDYPQWHALFSCRAMRVFTILTALATMAHAWIGLWAVLTDYVKHTVLRLFIQLAIVLTLVVELLWLIDLLWQ